MPNGTAIWVLARRSSSEQRAARCLVAATGPSQHDFPGVPTEVTAANITSLSI
jgi:hypothetical protein